MKPVSLKKLFLFTISCCVLVLPTLCDRAHGATALDKQTLLRIIRETAQRQKVPPCILSEVDWERDPPSVLAIARKLQIKRLSVSWKRKPLTEAIEEIQSLTGVPFVFTSRAKKLIRENNPTSQLQVKNLRVADILDLLAEQTGIIRFRIKGGAVLVLTTKEFRPRVVLKIYNVGDILHRPRDFPSPHLGVTGFRLSYN